MNINEIKQLYKNLLNFIDYTEKDNIDLDTLLNMINQCKIAINDINKYNYVELFNMKDDMEYILKDLKKIFIYNKYHDTLVDILDNKLFINNFFIDVKNKYPDISDEIANILIEKDYKIAIDIIKNNNIKTYLPNIINILIKNHKLKI